MEFFGDDGRMQLIGMTPRKIRDAGIHLSFVPEDRLGMGLVGSMGMIDNMMLKSYDSGKSFLADRKGPRELAEKVKEELGVVTPGVNTPSPGFPAGTCRKCWWAVRSRLTPLFS